MATVFQRATSTVGITMVCASACLPDQGQAAGPGRLTIALSGLSMVSNMATIAAHATLTSISSSHRDWLRREPLQPAMKACKRERSKP